MNFRVRLFIGLLTVSLLPIFTFSYLTYQNNKKMLIQEAVVKVEAIATLKKIAIERLFHSISKQALTLANSPHTLDAAKEFSKEFFAVEESIAQTELSSLQNYYDNEFGVKFNKLNNTSLSGKSLLDGVSDREKRIQHALISVNPSALGEKNKMTKVSSLENYSKIHEKYHPSFNQFLEEFGYYDIFIIEAKSGNIVYSVFKELDYATSLLSGPYSQSGLAKAFKGALNITSKNEYYFEDFETYLPSYLSAASFIATPIWDEEKIIGVLAFQMPLGKINEVMNERTGLGVSGQSYIYGADKKLRSDLFKNDQFSIDKSFKENVLISSTNIDKSLKGESGSLVDINFKGDTTVQSFASIDILGKKWGLVTEIDADEALIALESLKINLFIITFGTFIFVVLFGAYMSKHLVTSVSNIVENLSKSSHEVQNSSQKLNLTSEKLASLVDLQASSIQETISAIDEIAAMSQNNTASAERATNLSQVAKNNVFKGKDFVDEMTSEIISITDSYSQIGESVKNNNKEFERIIGVINGIAEKTKVINDIVFQTKLLSFNASVEAARAGEHGKGFAVVAEEVGNLATMSGNSADEIAKMLADSISQVNTIAESTTSRIQSIIDSGHKKIKQGAEVSNKCKDQLDEILISINELDQVVQEVSGASTEQTRGIDEINTSMRTLDKATHDTSDTSTISAKSAEGLHEQSTNLRAAIESLRSLMGTKKKVRT